jgi:lipopolysaccharide transport system ATP-binding protein
MSEFRIITRGLTKCFRPPARGIRDWFSPTRVVAEPQRAARTKWALDAVDLQVKAGTILAVLGANGSGKSTLLKILSRITRPSSGAFVLNGKPVAVLGTDGALHPDFHVVEAVRLQSAFCLMSRRMAEDRLPRILKFAGLERSAHLAIRELSSGTRVRLLTSVALHSDWDIFFADETLSALDLEFRWKCEALLRDRVAAGASVLVVSHDWEWVSRFCNEAICLDRGRIVQKGVASDVVLTLAANLSLLGGQSGSIGERGMDQQRILESVNDQEKTRPTNSV